MAYEYQRATARSHAREDGFYDATVSRPMAFEWLCISICSQPFWMAAMTKFELSFAYPFMSLSFVLVFSMSMALFGEAFTWGKLLGLCLVVSGLIVVVKY